MPMPVDNEVVSETLYIDRNHSQIKATLMSLALSMCITVDILQYSMPLAFLPSVLEDRGHSPMRIASAIGVYYWTGFIFQVILTSYQIWRLVSGKGHDDQGSSVDTVSRQIKYLIIGLGIGAATLIWQALSPRWHVHLICRSIQGAAGAVIFFYTILLSASMFKDGQKTFAMCASTIALNVAEVLGATLGAVIFHHYGQRAVFWFLGIASILNQIVLVGVLATLKGTQKPPSPLPPSRMPSCTVERQLSARTKGWNKLFESLRSEWLQIAVILIFVAACVKGSVEEMLPFYADHQWHYDPLMIGKLFAIIAIAYILASTGCGYVWEWGVRDWAVGFSASCLSLLGVSAYMVFHTASLELQSKESILWVSCAVFGCFLGLTHTPSALLIGDVIENEGEAAKGVVNGIWNTMWEFGGSVGFFAGGALADNYANKLALCTAYIFMCLFGGGAMAAIAHVKRAHITDEKKPLLPDNLPSKQII